MGFLTQERAGVRPPRDSRTALVYIVSGCTAGEGQVRVSRFLGLLQFPQAGI